MEMKPYGRKTKYHGRSPAGAQYSSHQQGPAYYVAPAPQPIDYAAAAGAAIYPPSYPPAPPAAAYFPPPPAQSYYNYPPDKRTVEGMVRKQIEYYFSQENLIKDLFLRNKMDKDGFVLLNEIAQFQRVMSLTQDMDTIISALKESETIEICDGIKVRPIKDPLRWPTANTSLSQFVPQPQPSQEHLQTVPQQLQDNLQPVSPREHIQPVQQQAQHLDHIQPAPQQQPQEHPQPVLQQQQQQLDHTQQAPLQRPNQPVIQEHQHQQQQQQQPIKSQQQQPKLQQLPKTQPQQPKQQLQPQQHQATKSQHQQLQQQSKPQQPQTLQQPHQPQQQSQSQAQKQQAVDQTQQAPSKLNSNQSQPQPQQQQPHQPVVNIPNNKHNKSSTPVESEWKEVKSRRRRRHLHS